MLYRYSILYTPEKDPTNPTFTTQKWELPGQWQHLPQSFPKNALPTCKAHKIIWIPGLITKPFKKCANLSV